MPNAKGIIKELDVLVREFITVTNMHIFPIHEQYVKYFPVLRALYNSSMIKNRKISSVSFSKMEVNIKTIENNWSTVIKGQ